MNLKKMLKPATSYQYPNVLEMFRNGKRYLFATSGTHAVGMVSDEPIDVMDTNNIGKMLSELLDGVRGSETTISLKALKKWAGKKKTCTKCKNTGTGECYTCDGTGLAHCECPNCEDVHESECLDCDNGVGDCICTVVKELGKIGNGVFQLDCIRDVVGCLPGDEARICLGETAVDPIRISGENYFAIVMPYRYYGSDTLPTFDVSL